MQETYKSLDIHVGQSMTFLVTLDKSVGDYYIVASSRFAEANLTTTATLRYSGSNRKVSGQSPIDPTMDLDWSMKQARTIRYSLFLICLQKT